MHLLVNDFNKCIITVTIGKYEIKTFQYHLYHFMSQMKI